MCSTQQNTDQNHAPSAINSSKSPRGEKPEECKFAESSKRLELETGLQRTAEAFHHCYGVTADCWFPGGG